eukprot:TRINITY_DN5892_c0_g7_i1.p1 TRINITY_DN5892_c0_g7~~TRINITY_DN5892_c0_g7_i1.p1  ORF type:complete len:1538 (+),score=692.51 TRINITY_DN5892_c0_g7_i1:89-4615(+)
MAAVLGLVGIGGKDYTDANLPAPGPGWKEGHSPNSSVSGGAVSAPEPVGERGQVPERHDVNGSMDFEPGEGMGMSICMPGMQKTRSEVASLQRQPPGRAAPGITVPRSMQDLPEPAPADTRSRGSHNSNNRPQAAPSSRVPLEGPGPHAKPAKAPEHCAIDILTDPDELDKWRPEVQHADPQDGKRQAALSREEYIPLRLARAKMKSMAGEVAKLKQEHLKAIERVETHYSTMKIVAEEKVRDYVQQLAAQHTEEMRKFRKEHKAKMKTVRSDLLGNVDTEVEAARQKVRQYQAEQEDAFAVTQRKMARERELFEEHKEKELGEVEKNRKAAMQRVTVLEEEIAALKGAHRDELEAKAAEYQMQAEASTAAKIEESERLAKKQREEGEMRKSIAENELRIAKETMAKEREALEEERENMQAKATSASDAVKAEVENKQLQFNTLYNTAKKGHAKMVKYRSHAASRIAENVAMVSIDLQQQYELKLAEVRAETAGGAKAAAAELTKAEEKRKSLAAEDAAKWDAERVELLAKITALEAAGEAKAAEEAASLQKASKVDQLKQVSTGLKAMNGSLTDRCAALLQRVASHHTTGQEAVALLVSLLLSEMQRYRGYVKHEKGVAAVLAAARCGADGDATKTKLEASLTTSLTDLKASMAAVAAKAPQDADVEAACGEKRAAIAAALAPWEEKSSALGGGAAAAVATLEKLQAKMAAQEEALVKHSAELAALRAKGAAAVASREEARKTVVAAREDAVKNLGAQVATKEKELAAAKAAPLNVVANGAANGDVEAPAQPSPEELEVAEEKRHEHVTSLQQAVAELKQRQGAAAAEADRSLADFEHSHAEEDWVHLSATAAALNAVHGALDEYQSSIHAGRDIVDASPGPFHPSDTDSHEAMGAKIAAAGAHTSLQSARDAYADYYRRQVLLSGVQQVSQSITAVAEATDVESKLYTLRNAAALAAAGPAVAGTGAIDPELQAKFSKALEEKKALAKQLKQAGERLAEVQQQTSEEMKAQESELRKDIDRLEKVAGNAALMEKELASTKEEVATLRKEHAEMKEVAADAQAVKDELKVTKKEAKELKKDNVEKTELFQNEAKLRKKYFNEVQDLKGKIRVMVRCRPMNKIEKSKDSELVVRFPDEYAISIPEKNKDWVFDQSFPPDSTQDQVWENSKHFVQSCIDGYNTCIFAYGQTGSGKTFTMEGSAEMPGLTPRCINEIFDTLKSMSSHYETTVKCYMTELYVDNLYDLLMDKKKYKNPGEYPNLDIKKGDKGIVEIQGITVVEVASAEELATEYMRGCKQRHVRSTGMNESSSRSHLVFGILTRTVNKKDGKVITGKMSLVDLAGSERLGKTGIKDEQGQAEAKSINKSLTALGDVIATLSSDPGGFIPYRNHKLTMLMSDSLGGNAKTMMIAAVSPASYNVDETANTLGYASRAKNITNDASKAAESKEIAKLKAQIARLSQAASEAGVQLDDSPPPENDKLDADKGDKKRGRSPAPSPSPAARKRSAAK